MTLLFIACPKPTPPDPAICEDGYHPCGPDSQECCLDTTSHGFVWTLDTIGLYGSDLFDAAIISEDDIWVVGEIYIADPDSVNGTGEAQYNAAQWNGVDWVYHVIYNLAPLHDVIAFGPDDVWFVNGIDVLHYDGSESVLMWRADAEQFGFYQITELWGTSPDNIYFAGRRGHIVHYDGTSFTHIPTDYDTDFEDITGTPDGEHVFIVGNPLARPGDDVILHSSGNPIEWERIEYPPDTDMSMDLLDAYSAIVSGDKLFISTEYDLWEYSFLTGESKLSTGIDHIHRLFKFTGAQSQNDLFFGGSKFDYLHYNGASYEYIDEIQHNYSRVTMKGGDFKDNLVVMTGFLNSWQHALVARGMR